MGKATARLLAREGYRVYGVYNKNRADSEKLPMEFDGITLFQCDFADRSNTQKLIEKLREVTFSGIVNSAGVFLPIDFENLDMDSWTHTFEVNLHAPLLLAYGLKDQLAGGASIVNIASTDGMIGSISGIAYSASKAAFINLSQSLANIFAKKRVRVNAIAPGWIGDGMRAPSELLGEAAALNPLKRVGTYEEIAQIVLFLLSDASSYINGTTIVADGGDSATSYILQKEAETTKSL